jgi:hypothetical protein
MAFSDKKKVRLIKNWFYEKLETFSPDELPELMSFLYTLNWTKIESFFQNKIQEYKDERTDTVASATTENADADELSTDISGYSE